MTRHRDFHFVARSVVVIVSLLTTYAVTYLALLRPRVVEFFPREDDNWTAPCATMRVSEYRLGGEISRAIFHPLNQLDIYARPEYWSPVCLEADRNTSSPATTTEHWDIR